MPKFYIFSDCHGFYKELREALNEAGFDENDENSWLIGAGDFTDRGPDPEKMINYLMGLQRFIGIKGNHESLTKELIQRKYAMSYDWHNCTVQSVLDLAPNAKTIDEACKTAWKKLKPFYDTLVDYVELEHRIICHGYLPCYKNPKKGYYELDPNWRSAKKADWEDARWINGMQAAMDKCDAGKCVICGHYHTSWGHAIQDKTFNEFGEGADFSPFYYEDKLIAIDGCCAFTGKINILKIEDEFIDGKS